MSNQILRIELFGALCLRKEDRAITRFQTRKTGALIAYLACFDRQLNRRDEIIEQLWPGEDPESSRNRLRMALTWLRKELGSPLETPDGLIIADRNVIYLNPALYTTDKAEYEAHIKAATQAATDAEQITHLQAAAALYRGELMPDHDEAWVRSERNRLADSYLMALRRLIKLLAEEREFDSAIEYARHAVNLDPLREESHRLLMRLYAAVGRPAAALRQYYELDDLLREELRMTPTSVTRQLAEHITGRQQHGADSGMTDGPPRDSGVAIAERPTLPTLPRRKERHPLRGATPTFRTPLLGREDSMTAVREMLETPETRLITLTGVGGCGKTRLALALAEQINQDYAGTVCFVQLGDLSDAQQIPAAIARALSIELKGRAPILDQVAGHLRQPTLLILDNFEHLAHGGPMVVRALLEKSPDLTCLITSRQRLNLSCEYEYGVRPLPVPLLAGKPDRLLEFASVQLFMARAHSVNPDFEITAENAADVAAICDRMDGLPLAIELAASWSSILTPAQILERLSTRFTLLVNSGHDIPARHTSLRAALDWSFALLEPEVQRFFARLSAFRGGWDLEAAQAVCEEPHTPHFLMQLHDRSLLLSETIGKKIRFSFLETVREYSVQCADAEERAASSRRHAAYFATIAEQAREGLRGQDAAAWHNRVGQDHDNFRAALQFALEDRNSEQALQIASSISLFWITRGHLAEGFEWLRRSLERAADAAPELRVRALMGAGNLAYVRGDYEAARPLYTEALALRRHLDDGRGIASCLNSLGNVAYETGAFREARLLFEEARSGFERHGDGHGKAIALSNLANVLGRDGDFALARECHQEALVLFRHFADLPNIALTLNNMAYKILHCPDFTAARPLLEESLRIGRILESSESVARSVMGFVMLASNQDENERAARLLGAVHSLREEFQGMLTQEAQDDYQTHSDRARRALGETACRKFWEKGRLLRPEQVYSYVLEAD